MITTQRSDPTGTDCGAFECPSTNPHVRSIHSRAAEMVYPLAVLAIHAGATRYAAAAIRVGDWLISIQQRGGAWGEESPHHDCWTGTTADQLISLAGAYPLLKGRLTPAQRRAWRRAIARAAAFIAFRMPRAHLNYAPTCAVALRLARSVVPWPRWRWALREKRYVRRTLRAVRPSGLLDGEGGGVDPGYNVAQTIGYLALYGILTRNESLREVAAEVMRTHAAFVYPNGTVDNSWGTRSYKWTLESGTKTAPGIYFTLALLLDRDPRFGELLDRCFDHLCSHAIHDGWIAYGPHSPEHASCTPPCNYGTFARAQSLALACVYGRERAGGHVPPTSETPQVAFFPDVNVAVVRTRNVVGTVSAYGAISQYPRHQVCRGGSVTNLWMQGYGPLGILQAASPFYDRTVEPMHLPMEQKCRALTPRIEAWKGGHCYSNVFEAAGEMCVADEADRVDVSVSGELRDEAGAPCGVHFLLTHAFFAERLEKRLVLRAVAIPERLVIVEPVVELAPAPLRMVDPQRVELIDGSGQAAAELRIIEGCGAALRAGSYSEEYWAPFPGLKCAPIEIDLAFGADGEAQIRYELRLRRSSGKAG